MTLTLDEIVFRSRALAQTHPFTHRAQAFVNATVARERREQPAEAMSDWASHGLTVGYCLRRIEEDDTGRAPRLDGESAAPPDARILDERTTELADLIRRGESIQSNLFLYPEGLVIEALDRIIFGEVDRRLSHYAEKLDPETFEELESYIGWWTLKGYCLRIAEGLVSADDGGPVQDGV